MVLTARHATDSRLDASISSLLSISLPPFPYITYTFLPAIRSKYSKQNFPPTKHVPIHFHHAVPPTATPCSLNRLVKSKVSTAWAPYRK